MNVLFVYPNIVEVRCIQLGIAYLSAVLKKAGHCTDLFDCTFIDNASIHRSFAHKIKQFRPDMIAVSSRSLEYPSVVELLSHVDEKIFTVIGGAHPTVAPEQVIACDFVDAIVVGEGEHALLELVTNLDNERSIEDIKNIWVKKNGEIIRNEIRPLLQNLDALPYPDIELFDERHLRRMVYFNGRRVEKRTIPFECSRGCPFSCTYCINAYLQALNRGKSKYHREKSIPRIIDELASLVQRLHLEYIYFVDETFLLDIDRLKEFSEAYASRINLPFLFMTRPELASVENIKLMAEAGANLVQMGIESGDSEFRKKVLRRSMTDDDIVRAFEITKKHGITTYSFNMIGLPYEDRKMIQKTIDLNRRIQPDVVQVAIFHPFEGTELMEVCKRENLIDKSKQATHYYQDSVLQLPNFREGQLFRISRLAPFYIKSHFLLVSFLKILESCEPLFILFLYRRRIQDLLCDLPHLFKKYGGLVNLAKEAISRYRRVKKQYTGSEQMGQELPQ